MGFDEDYLRAMEYGMPPAGGWASASTAWSCCSPTVASIRDVLLFPHMRPEA
jgi:lysyl-tRNA synthetase, class II